MVKLQKQISRRIGEKLYERYIVVIPKKVVEKSLLEKGDSLDIYNDGAKIIIKKTS